MADMIDTSRWPAGTRYFTQVTDENHAGWLYIITILSFVYVCVVFIIRFIVKYGMYGLDDWALLGASVLAVGQYISILAGLGKGVGKSSRLISIERIDEIEKMSTALLTQRLFENGRIRNARLCWGLVGASAIYGLGAVLSAAIGCPTAAFPVGDHDTCSNRFLRWQIILALDIVTEALLVIIPLTLVLDILMKGSAKITVTIVFAFRLMDIFFAAMNLRQIAILQNTSDFGMDIVPALIWTQSELLWSIISASLPCLKTFMRPFDKIDDDSWRSNYNKAYSSSRSGGRSWKESRDREGTVPLEAIGGQRKGNIFGVSGSDRGLGLRPEPIGHDVEISHPITRESRVDEAMRGWGSQERTIKASTQWSVRREGGRDPYEIP